ncbi:hypothetical protein ACE10Z_34150 [Bradyrhizobium sp. Pha-3]|uniref:hypothetical protein n=1 Tax=Bradyrhizobium sp. Pha-3 TaxID=208375 RepID=UPI0035D492FC
MTIATDLRMDIKEFGDIDRQPVRLVVWRVTVPDPVSWRRDPRRASHVQEEHLRSADGGPGWLGAAFELPLRSRLAKNGSALHRATIDPGAAALEQTVVVTAQVPTKLPSCWKTCSTRRPTRCAGRLMSS